MRTLKEICQAKEAFQSRGEARTVARRQKNKRTLYVYKCDCCGLFHLTHRTQDKT